MYFALTGMLKNSVGLPPSHSGRDLKSGSSSPVKRLSAMYMLRPVTPGVRARYNIAFATGKARLIETPVMPFFNSEVTELDSRLASPVSHESIRLTSEVGRHPVNTCTVLEEWAHAREGSHKADNLRSVSVGDWLA